MSGGVDSSVSAALLKELGFDVTGVFIKVWSPDFLPCNWQAERRDAMRVCAELKIPFLTFDFEDEYKKGVVDYMVEEYRVGRTPNPDVMCNKHIKFGSFLKKAREMGADFIATGHYSIKKELDGVSELWESKDESKDQSYFLWTLDQEQLDRVIFPVGGLIKKTEVRDLAKKFNLPTAAKKDSQGLCFMGKIDVKEFLKHFVSEKKGDVLDVSGKIIGEHTGAFFLTIGQRRGFKITKKTSSDLPYYIIGKDISKNTITVSNKTAETNFLSDVKKVFLESSNWISGNFPDESQEYICRTRYRQKSQTCRIKKIGGGNVTGNTAQNGRENAEVIFTHPQSSVSIGQSLVLYSGKKCLGGGIIDRVEKI